MLSFIRFRSVSHSLDMHNALAHAETSQGIVGCYGSITEQYMERIFQSMGEHTLFDRQSILVDIGAGLGK